jgi:outer membrane protein OmpA-like peptidoglycan-associated protein
VSMKKTIIISVILLLAMSAVAQKKTYHAKMGDKAYAVFNFHRAIDFYAVDLRKHKGDSVYLQQQTADAYRMLNQPADAEAWYRKVVGRADKPMNKFYLAEALRANQKSVSPADKNVDEILVGIDSIGDLSKDKGIFKIELANFNSGASDFGPAYYKDGKLFFTSNRNGRRDNNLIDNWSGKNYYQVFIAKPQAQGQTSSFEVKRINGCKSPNGKFHDGPVAFNAANNELIYTRSNYKKSCSKTAADKKTVHLELFSMTFGDKKRSKKHQLSMNSKDYSSAHPALSRDGNTLYFTSDRPGGFGGSDLYMTIRSSASAPWEAPVNLGSAVNTKYDEKLPFMASDSILYFASDALGGLGGLDIYMTKKENGKWSKPENVGYPINSNRDDFSFIVDSANAHGFFASNRTGGMGDDDIYAFTMNRPKLYNVKVLVVDAFTKEPIKEATLMLSCPGSKDVGNFTDKQGIKEYAIKVGVNCSVTASKDDYAPATAQITAADKNGTITIPLAKKVLRLLVHVKDKETLAPLNNVGVYVTPTGKPSYTFSTDSLGGFTTEVPVDQYSISSPEFASIGASIGQTDADKTTGIITRDFLVDRYEMKVMVPLTANCFTHTVAYTDLTTNERKEVQPNKEMNVRLDLNLNKKYAIEHNGRIDTISTHGLRPGDVIDGPCKFYIGQVWVINNIYYDLDKSFIRKDAAKELDNVVRIMKENPTLEIELGSHTDCRQTAKYNEQLSVRRAKAAVNYIVSKKVRMNRILAAGYGESKPVNGCVCEPTNVSECTDDQHSKNRRTAIKVLKY